MFNEISKPKNIDLLQVRSNKAEEEVAELMKKSTQLESELDKTKEELVWSCNYDSREEKIFLSSR